MAFWELKIASMSKTVFFKFILLSVLLVGCSQTESLPFYNSPDFKPLFLSAQGAQKEVPHTIASFAFKNQMDQIIGTKDVIGKVHIANFMFTQCGSICPIMTNNLKRLEEQFMEQKDVVMLSYSVTPWIDSVPKLKSYTQDYEITKREWHFLTGKTSDIYNLARKSYFAEEDLGFTKDSTDFLHTEHVLLIDQALKIRGVYNGTLPLEIMQLAKDIELLLEKSSL